MHFFVDKLLSIAVINYIYVYHLQNLRPMIRLICYAYVVALRRKDPKLIIRVVNFELVQPICSRYINVTDGRTDGRSTYDSSTALAVGASCGKS